MDQYGIIWFMIIFLNLVWTGGPLYLLTAGMMIACVTACGARPTAQTDVSTSISQAVDTDNGSVQDSVVESEQTVPDPAPKEDVSSEEPVQETESMEANSAMDNPEETNEPQRSMFEMD